VIALVVTDVQIVTGYASFSFSVSIGVACLMFSFSRSSAVLGLIGVSMLAIATGCGGGNATSGFPKVPVSTQPSAPVGSAPTAVQLTISIPSTTTASSKKRHALYVSSATNSATFTPAGGATTLIALAPASPGCTNNASGRECAVAVSIPSGNNVSYRFATFASTDGSGTPLSIAVASAAIVPNTSNAINITLNAVVSSVAVSVSPATFTVGQAASASVGANVIDAAGKTIVAAPSDLVDANDNPVSLVLASSLPIAALSSTNGSASPITLAYNGAATTATSGTVSLSAVSTANPSLALNAATYTFVTHASYVATVLANHPIAYYRLNDAAGTTMADSSGNSKTGTYVASPQLGGPALLSGDTSAKSVSFAHGYATSSATWTNQAVTAECWIRPTAADVGGGARIMGNGWTDHSGNGFMLWMTSGTIGFNAGWNAPVGTSAVVAGQTYHVVGTYDNATGATLYINGIAVSNVMPGAVPNPQTGDFNGTTYIGVLNAAANGGLTDYFQGAISDCALYDHALTPSDVATHYNAGAAAHVVPVPIPTVAPTMAPPPQTPAPAPITYTSTSACIAHTLYTNDVLPSGEGEFETNGLDRSWWGRLRGNTLGGNQYSGFRTSWGRNQYDTYFGDASDGLPGGHDPFTVAHDTQAPGSPQGVRIDAYPMPADLIGNPQVNGASYYSGVLDTPVNQQYGFFVARVRVPAPAAGMSPAWWMLSNNGMPQGAHGSLNGEWDIQEMFGNDYGSGMNAGNIEWNSGSSSPQNWGGTYAWTAPLSGSPSSDYHDYGALLSAGGATINPNTYGPGGPGDVYGPVNQGVTNFVDGVPLYGHTGGADLTQGVGWKELMAMFQVAPQGSWLGSPVAANFPASYWVQWIRVYRPTTTSC
jgi:hypothetical protein